ncbi:ABC transporter permease [Rhodococcus sp. X156]|uniref:ABC transporter permease n=1 Tax=Rhodococcus sp. X156 TaxID=2499145 RepID=UPI000FD8D602|nr:ABC transporter permease [Rhodococcus sp. X156]
MGVAEPGSVKPSGTEAPDTGSVEAGLDALSTEVTVKHGWGQRLRRSVLPPVVAVALVLLVWQLYASTRTGSAAYNTPSPTDVWETFRTEWSSGAAWESVYNSVRRGIVGFAIAVVIGAPLGLLIARVPLVRTAIGPIVSGLQSLPSVAWVPAAIILIGLTPGAMYFVIVLGAVPSIANGLVAGLDQVPPLYARVGTVLGANWLQQIRYVLLPASLPGFIAGLKQGWAFSWRSLMAAEIISYSPALGRSLGQMLNQGRELSDLSLVVVAIIMILIVGVAIDVLIFAPLERRVLRSRGLLVSR